MRWPLNGRLLAGGLGLGLRRGGGDTGFLPQSDHLLLHGSLLCLYVSVALQKEHLLLPRPHEPQLILYDRLLLCNNM